MRSESLWGTTGSYTAAVDPSNGRFKILSTGGGVRHLIVVGRDGTPLKAFARDHDERKSNDDLGVFDLSDSCPEADE